MICDRGRVDASRRRREVCNRKVAIRVNVCLPRNSTASVAMLPCTTVKLVTANISTVAPLAGGLLRLPVTVTVLPFTATVIELGKLSKVFGPDRHRPHR